MNWWRRFRNRGVMEEQLDRELRFHIEQHAADLIKRGVDPGEARRQARLALGGPEQVKENCRDARGTRWLEDLLQDFHYALRTMRQRPGFAGVTLSTLALGIGATTVMFTVVNGVLLRPLPFLQPGTLVTVQEQTSWRNEWGNVWAFTYPNFVDCKRENRSLDLAAWRYGGGTLTSAGEPEYVEGREVSADLLSMLGVHVLRGRGFLREEDRLGAPPVAIISDQLWRSRYAARESAIGTPLVYDGKPYTIIGVAPAGLRLDGPEAGIITLLGQNTSPAMQNRQAHGVRVWGRLRPGATLSQAQMELSLIAGRLAKEYPKSNAGRTFVAEPLHPDVGDVRSTLWLLMGAACLVLLIACVNVASLLLARAVSRERELAMRVALGAGRGRLVRQCLTESAVLGICGGVLGLALAAVGIKPFVAFWPGTLPRVEEIQLDWRVLLAALAASLLSGLLFGIAPALRAPSRDLEQSLRAGARTVVGASRRLHSGFVVSEIALAVVLLVSAGMLGRTLLRLSLLDPGVNVRNVLITRAALSPATLADPGKTRAAWDDILDRGRRIPGVQSIAIVDTVPMRQGNNQLGYWTTAALPPADRLPLALATSVSPGYLNVMGIPMREGRFFNDQDRQSSEPVVIIDEVMAQHAFGGQRAVGKQLWIPGMGPRPLQVVGVVGHVRHWGLAGDDQARVRDQFYYPFAQLPDKFVRRWSELMSLAVRTNVDPLTVVEPLRQVMRGAAGDQVLYEVRTLDQLANGTLAKQRFLLLLFAVFAGLALLLACIGIYGVLAYLTSRRIPEIGVRLALGATARNVMQLVLRESLLMIFIGVTLGASGAVAAARVLHSFVTGMQSTEPSTFAAMTSVLVIAALFASFLPARRASRVDPLRALRQE